MLDAVVRGSASPPSLYSLSGLEHVRAWLRTTVPAAPLPRLIGYRPTQAGSGSVALVLPTSPWLQLYDATFDFTVLVEEALALAVLSGAPPAREVVTATLALKHFRPVTTPGQSIVARARVINSGSVFTVAEVLVEDALGRAVAHATGAMLLRAIVPEPPAFEGFPDGGDDPVFRTPDPPLRPAPPEDFLADDRRSLDIFSDYVAERAPLPPFFRLLGIGIGDVTDDGVGIMTIPASPWFCCRTTDVQQGVVAALMHLGLNTSALAVTEAGESVGVIDQSMTFLRSVEPDGRDLTSRFELVHRGGELLVSSVEVADADGVRVALGTQTSVVRRRRRTGTGTGTARRERVLATVLFTDIVGSTQRVEELGDDAWRMLLAEHDAVVRRQLKATQGREVKSTGDGFLASFESPAQAVRCARSIRDGVARLGLEVRAGIHTGECERVGTDLVGIAVHAAARIQAAAGPGEVLVSSTVADLVSGSGITFADRGTHELKGLKGPRQLFVVTG